MKAGLDNLFKPVSIIQEKLKKENFQKQLIQRNLKLIKKLNLEIF